ncbi:MAG: hypothetical protein KDA32_09365 [Phycisphaerales bacterium]|nr:hypothetical protein [Phycisphaerales bacterium]
MVRHNWTRKVAIAGISAGCLVGQSLAGEYRNDTRFRDAVTAFVANSGQSAQASVLAKTAGGREAPLLQVATPGDTPIEARRAILLVGGIDSDCPATAETALDVITELVSQAHAEADGPAARLLHDYVIYVVPRLNPDGIERFFEKPQQSSRLNGRAVDDDRDGLVNEDGPDDLDGDGVISVMRVAEPGGEWMIDPEHPNLMRRADASKGEVGVYRILLEGRDDDNDGHMNEDGAGGVDPDRNWPHFYESGEIGVGAHQVSEPETLALARFVVDHPRIAAIIVYGRNDNIVSPPKGEQRDAAGVAYRDLHPDDVKLYAHISEKYQELTGLKRSSKGDPRGAFYAWAYAQRGIPVLATSVWAPEADKPDDAKPADTSDADVAEGAADDDEAQVENKPERRKKKDKSDDPEETDPVGLRVISNADNQAAHGGAPLAGEWRPFDHPTLGRVELGGVAPFATTAPAPEELDAIAKREATFVLDIADRLPRLSLRDATCKAIGPGVWEIELTLVNDGYLPTRIGAARLAECPPTIVRPDLPPERVLGGKRLERVPVLAGSGGAAKLRWLISGADGETVTFIAGSVIDPEIRVEVKLAAADKEKAQ